MDAQMIPGSRRQVVLVGGSAGFREISAAAAFEKSLT
jgi:hypothetical protein